MCKHLAEKGEGFDDGRCQLRWRILIAVPSGLDDKVMVFSILLVSLEGDPADRRERRKAHATDWLVELLPNLSIHHSPANPSSCHSGSANHCVGLPLLASRFLGCTEVVSQLHNIPGTGAS